jgi:hypothetical protein
LLFVEFEITKEFSRRAGRSSRDVAAIIEFYLDFCREAGEVLEVGCGTGRLIPAALAGCEVPGMAFESR